MLDIYMYSFCVQGQSTTPSPRFSIDVLWAAVPSIPVRAKERCVQCSSEWSHDAQPSHTRVLLPHWPSEIRESLNQYSGRSWSLCCAGWSHMQNPNVDIQNDWKLLTIFIGTNDLCLGSVLASVVKYSPYTAAIYWTCTCLNTALYEWLCNRIPVM